MPCERWSTRSCSSSRVTVVGVDIAEDEPFALEGAGQSAADQIADRAVSSVGTDDVRRVQVLGGPVAVAEGEVDGVLVLGEPGQLHSAIDGAAEFLEPAGEDSLGLGLGGRD